jgi:hypothetical protein
MSNFDAYKPPEQNKVFRFSVGTTHATTEIPAALKNRMVTFHAYTQDVFVLFGGRSLTASELAVDRSAAPSNAAASGFGLKLEKDHPEGYRFFVSDYWKLISLEASGSAYVAAFPSSDER